jgi:hypothetical protein
MPIKAHLAGNILEKSMFLRVSFKVLGNSKKVSNSVLRGSNDTPKSEPVPESSESLEPVSNPPQAASLKKLLKIQKTILESSELEAIKSADGKMRSRLYDLCLPYDMGVMLLPLDLLEHVNGLLSEYAQVRADLVETFAIAYPERVKTAEQNLAELATVLGVPVGTLLDPNDFPPPDVIRNRFGFDWQYLTFQTPESLKAMGMYEAEQEKMQAKMAVVTEEITAVMRQTLSEMVNHLADALAPSEDGNVKRLHTSAVTNIQAFLKTFEARNITGDKDLAKLAADVQALITPDMDMQALKKNADYKSSVQASMASLGSQLADLVEEMPSRKFRAVS